MQEKVGARKKAPLSSSKVKALEALFENVSAKVTPTAEESEAERKFALGIAGKLQEALNAYGVKVFLVGSTARDTGLRGDRDIDLFACFPVKHSREEIVELTVDATRKSIAGSWQMHYAEHPYLQAKLGNYAVEVIPCFEAKPHTQIKSAVDRSPLHMDYLQKRLNLKQKRDVRVLKKLLKGAGVYGAESRVEGFSGLLCEYLILNYRSLVELLEAASNWRPPVVIDIEGIRTEEEGGEEQIAKSFNTPLVLIDAIDKKRNAAAAVGPFAFATFVSVSRSLLNSPSESLFFSTQTTSRREMPAVELQKAMDGRGTAFLMLEFPVPKDLVEDILYPQLRKTVKSLIDRLNEEEFKVIDSTEIIDGLNAFVFIEFACGLRSKVKKLVGPPAWLGKETDEFVASHPTDSLLRGPFIEGDRVVVERLRMEVEASAVVADLLLHERAVSIGPNLAAGLKRAKLLEGKEIVKALEAQGHTAALIAVEDYLFKKLFWL